MIVLWIMLIKRLFGFEKKGTVLTTCIQCFKSQVTVSLIRVSKGAESSHGDTFF